jgi:hypothetical protein
VLILCLRAAVDVQQGGVALTRAEIRRRDRQCTDAGTVRALHIEFRDRTQAEHCHQCLVLARKWPQGLAFQREDLRRLRGVRHHDRDMPTGRDRDLAHDLTAGGEPLDLAAGCRNARQLNAAIVLEREIQEAPVSRPAWLGRLAIQSSC